MGMSRSEEEQVVLVNERDEELGTMEKMEAHRRGALHRAFSVFLFDAQGRLLLQRRASGKYHSADLWTNTCCSHPRPGEEVMVAARRRLREEMGIDRDLTWQFNFIYRAELDHGLSEYELDHVLFGSFSDDPSPDRNEADAWRCLSLADLEQEVRHSPERFTVWLLTCLPQVKEKWPVGH